MLMLRSTHNTITGYLNDSAIKIEASLREKVSERDATIALLREELAQLKMKNERMEIAMMPLSSVAGARYIEQINPRKPVTDLPATPDETLGWHAYLNKFMVSEEIAIAAERKNNEEQFNGIQSA